MRDYRPPVNSSEYLVCFRNSCPSKNNIEAAVIKGPGGKVTSIVSYILFSKVHLNRFFFPFCSSLS